MYSDEAAAGPCVVGVDVGGTKIAAALVDAGGRLSGLTRCPTDVSSPQATLEGIAATVGLALQAAGASAGQVLGVGLGIPGLVDPDGGIGLASVNLGWRDVAVTAYLQQRLGLPCRIENDVRAAGLGEAAFGAARGLDNFIYLSLGTGVAAAVILDGRVWRGAHGLAGEIGHTQFDPELPPCKCGGVGCLEALVSGPAIAARAALKLKSAQSRSSLDPATPITAQAVFAAARLGDALALESVDEACAYLARAVQWLALAYDPQLIVLGGGVSQAGELLLEPLSSHLRRLAQSSWVFGGIYSPQLVQVSPLGENSGVLGAAALFTDT